MKHKLSPSQYGVLAAITCTASLGDTLLSRGMSQIGPVDPQHLMLLLRALLNPYILVGIVLLIGFFAFYTQALSWADLTFLMPATALNHVVIAVLGRYWLHEHLSLSRWTGIFLIVCAVSFVAGGPPRTDTSHSLEQMDSGIAL